MDPLSGENLPLWELWADDARAVLDAVSSERAVICGLSDSGPAAILFVGSHPSRASGLILVNSHAINRGSIEGNGNQATQYDEEFARFVAENWGTQVLAEYISPGLAERDPLFGRWFAKNQRMYMPPGVARRSIGQQVDVRDVLPLVQVPTLVLHHNDFQAVPVEHGHYLAEHIANAYFTVLPGRDGWVFAEPADESMRQIDDFLRGLTAVAVPDRALAAILFTDIVGSTERASTLGDRAWRNLLATHDALARTVVDQHKGRVVKMTGDGMLAMFDGPGRAIQCALSLGDALRTVGLEIRAGLHTGEVEVMGEDIAGISVHIAARVLDAAIPGEVFVSPAVPMLVAGAGFEFDDRGKRDLKGIPGEWNLFAVKGSTAQ
jgi:class 3 adenylate cyclase